jgi:hypothetical protein
MKLKCGLYRHFKGGIYIVTGTATHTETGEMFALYKRAGKNSVIWARPLSMFLEKVDGKQRFTYLEDECMSCKYGNLSVNDFPCDACYSGSMYEYVEGSENE